MFLGEINIIPLEYRDLKKKNTLKSNGNVVESGVTVCLDGHLALDAVQRGVRGDKTGGLLLEIDADLEARGLAGEGVH